MKFIFVNLHFGVFVDVLTLCMLHWPRIADIVDVMFIFIKKRKKPIDFHVQF